MTNRSVEITVEQYNYVKYVEATDKCPSYLMTKWLEILTCNGYHLVLIIIWVGSPWAFFKQYFHSCMNLQIQVNSELFYSGCVELVRSVI